MAPSAVSTITDYANANVESNPGQLIRARGSSYSSGYDGPAVSKAIVADALKQRVEGVNGDTCEAGEEDTFFVADLGQVYRQHLRWKMNLKRVKPHYGTCQFPIDYDELI